MRNIYFVLLTTILLSFQSKGTNDVADPSDYFDDVKTELKKEWPGNRTINLVFHGHSVPAGYLKLQLLIR